MEREEGGEAQTGEGGRGDGRERKETLEVERRQM